MQEYGRTRLEMNCKIKSTFNSKLFALNVVVRIPVPKYTANANMQVGLDKEGVAKEMQGEKDSNVCRDHCPWPKNKCVVPHWLSVLFATVDDCRKGKVRLGEERVGLEN